MRKSFLKTTLYLAVLFLSAAVSNSQVSAQSGPKQNGYHNHEQITNLMKELQTKNPAVVKIHNLASTPSKRDLLLFEIGSETASDIKSNPAVLVVANLEGKNLLGTEAAISLAELIL
jgi:hypothetical protein